MKIAFISAPQGEANGLARRAVESELAACVNVIFGMTSHYWWHGEIQTDSEALLIAKVADESAEEFVRRMREWHSYGCPEIILTEVVGGNPDYLEWVRDPRRDSGDQKS